MKKLSVLILTFAVIFTVFSACSDKNESETATTSTTVIGKVENSYVHYEGIGKTMVYETADKQPVKLEIYGDDGKIKYIEEYIYDNQASICGYNYYTAEGDFAARYLIGEKQGYYYEDGSVMEESVFSQKMNALGVYSY